ncbi:MAG: c-type cytochrome biogenesis protein CcsB [Deltaproteobacteria bacterium]|nr:MAG: c-type cytochrome biogenesis protein CcsB [Deltaproteobacteria bacterium]
MAATLITLGGFLVNTAAIGVRWVESYKLGFGYVPLSNMYESMVFFSWSTVLIYLIFEYFYGYKAIGVLATALGFLGIAIVSLTGVSSEIQPLVPALQSNWLTAHVVTCFVGYAAFAVSYAICILYLIRTKDLKQVLILSLHPLVLPLLVSFIKYGNIKPNLITADNLVAMWIVTAVVGAAFFGLYLVFSRADDLLPPLKVLDELSYKAVAVGFPLLTLGILTGAAWANYAWGTYWSWDPKETWSLITWFVYAAFLHARFTAGWRGKGLAWLSVIGFGAVVFTYWGVNYVLSGLHSYA